MNWRTKSGNPIIKFRGMFNIGVLIGRARQFANISRAIGALEGRSKGARGGRPAGGPCVAGDQYARARPPRIDFPKDS